MKRKYVLSVLHLSVRAQPHLGDAAVAAAVTAGAAAANAAAVDAIAVTAGAAAAANAAADPAAAADYRRALQVHQSAAAVATLLMNPRRGWIDSMTFSHR